MGHRIYSGGGLCAIALVEAHLAADLTDDPLPRGWIEILHAIRPTHYGLTLN